MNWLQIFTFTCMLLTIAINIYVMFIAVPNMRKHTKDLRMQTRNMLDISDTLNEHVEKNVNLRKELEDQIAMWKARNAELTSSAWH